MKKKINQILNIVMASFVGQLIGYGLYQFWHFCKYPKFHEMQSAPWYTSILARGLFTLVILTICIILKVILTEKIVLMKKAVLISGIVLLTLTFTGGGYVLINHGQANAGYAVVPGIWAMICFGYYQSRKHD